MKKLLGKIRGAWNHNALVSFFGVTGMGFFLSFLILVEYGTDPATFMNLSVSSAIGWTLGNWQLLFNISLLMLVILINRSIIGFGTLFNMVLLGYYADFFCWLFRQLLPTGLFTDQPWRGVIFAVALIGFVITAAVYMNAGAGLSPYDGAAKLFANCFKKIPFFIPRMVYDFAAIGVGMLAGGRPTIGIILIAIFLGPVITIVGRVMQRLSASKTGG